MKIYNSLTKSIEDFKTLKKDETTIYVCGITPYDTTHLGHAFTYISFDVLIRFLKFKGFKVTYTQNVTDINDRDKDILERAKEQEVSWEKLSDFWTKKFLEDMKALNWVKPDNYLFASEQIAPMIKLIKKLLKNKIAYEINGSAYLDISKGKDFGKLSKFSKNKMLKVARDFEEDLDNPHKRNKLDITLWRSSEKGQPKHIPSFNSPWGKGRPGWHLECSAMGISSLGEQIDIHGGGKDLIFPHHEAEVAQSEGATGKKPFAKLWIHTGTVFYKKEKMSKSKGNLVMVSKLLEKYYPNAIRWLLLSHSWNKNWEYFEKDLKNAQKNADLIELAIKNSSKQKVDEKIISKFTEIMDNNLNTPKALKFILSLIKKKSIKEAEYLYNILGFTSK